jgi:putative FmdB family regulatory protein
MPVYTYHCTNCGVQFDKQLSFTDLQPTRCPECGKKTLKKIFQPVGIVFKGSGFYATDHHSPSGQSSKKDDRDRKEGGESKGSEPKAEKSSEKREDGGNKEATTKTEKSPEAKE